MAMRTYLLELAVRAAYQDDKFVNNGMTHNVLIKLKVSQLRPQNALLNNEFRQK
jgi:hypothetical protein